MKQQYNERGVLMMIMLLQFIFLTTGMMIMPLGPDLTLSIQMDPTHIGYLNAAATLAAAVAGIMFAPFIDRFERRSLFVIAVLCKSILVGVCAFASDTMSLATLLMCSAVFGGPAAALMMAIVMDVVPQQRRGKAMAMVASAFSLSAIFGVPLMLVIAQWSSWSVAFVVVAVAGVLACIALYQALPPMRAHLEAAKPQPKLSIKSLLSRPEIMLSLMLVSCHMLGHFMLVPNIASFFQFNLSFPRDWMGPLYLAGGIASLVALQLTGRLVDKGYQRIVMLALTALIVSSIYLIFISPGWVSLFILFMVFMAATSARTSATMACISRFPKPYERAGFMSLQTTVGNVAAGLAGLVSAQLLTAAPNNALQGVPELAYLALALMLLHPIVFVFLDRKLPEATARPKTVEQQRG